MVAAAIAAAATIGSAVIGSNAAGQASKTQANAAANAQRTQLGMYNNERADLSPFTSAGVGAQDQLARLFGYGPGGTGPSASTAMSQLTAFPGYQFGLQQGGQALDRSAASRGLLLSGAQLQDAQKFGQGYAQQQAWQPYVNQLNTAAGLGENAAAMVGNAGIATGQGVAQSQLGQGQATAAGQVQQGNIFGAGLQQLGQQAGQFFSSYGTPVVQAPAGSAPNPGLDSAYAAAQSQFINPYTGG
jgi:hypothetical protein